MSGDRLAWGEPARDDGGRAFPRPDIIADGSRHVVATGMSLRDYFAAHALAIIPHMEILEPRELYAARIAEHAYQYADAMLAERSK